MHWFRLFLIPGLTNLKPKTPKPKTQSENTTLSDETPKASPLSVEGVWHLQAAAVDVLIGLQTSRAPVGRMGKTKIWF